MWFDADPPGLIERLQRRAIDYLLDHFLAFYLVSVGALGLGWAWEYFS